MAAFINMKEMADKIIEEFHKRMESYPDSRFVTDEDINLSVLIARIKELEGDRIHE